jgi:hypothetical protein
MLQRCRTWAERFHCCKPFAVMLSSHAPVVHACMQYSHSNPGNMNCSVGDTPWLDALLGDKNMWSASGCHARCLVAD